MLFFIRRQARTGFETKQPLPRLGEGRLQKSTDLFRRVAGQCVYEIDGLDGNFSLTRRCATFDRRSTTSLRSTGLVRW